MKKDFETVTYTADDHVAVISLQRPDQMNAFDEDMRRDLATAQKLAETDENIRVVILTGSGRAFSAGTDLKEFAKMIAPSGIFDNSIRDYKPLIDGIAQSDKIYIAAINGFAGGVALGLSLGADLAIMADDAKIFSPFANIGLVPDGGATWHLFQSMGYKRAFAAIAECERLDAQTCMEMGMVNKVVPASELQSAALTWAHNLAEKAPLSLRYTKKILRQVSTMSRAETARLESEYQMIVARSDDAKTAVKAFISKEKPTFKGR